MNKNTHAVLCASLGACLFLGGCVPHKQAYKQPKLPTPPAWQSGLPDQQAAAKADAPAPADLKWAEFFTDDKLRQVIDLALRNNHDLRLAALNVLKVQAQYRIQRAQQYPGVDVGATGQAAGVPSDLASNGQASTSGSSKVGVQVASWELDLFGRVRNLKDAALQQYLASEQGRKAAQITLVASVANSYLTLAADRDSLRLAQATLEAQKATYDLIRESRDLGVKSDLDLSQARSQVEAAQVDIARYSGQVTLDENALNLLVGTSVPSDLLQGGLGADEGMKDVSAGLPSDVLLRRPDILQAEHQLKASYANIGAARANYFPRITLTGMAGTTSDGLSNLFQSGSRGWSFAPQVLLPLFDAGTRNANYKIAQVDRDAAVTEYEKAIQTAFREVSDSLSQRTRLMEQQNAQQALVNSLGETFRLTDARYKAGVDNYLSVLVAQRSLYSGQQALVNLRLARLSNLVTLYKVLGGGAQ
jgi:multidrug efflux system outer membrane protein